MKQDMKLYVVRQKVRKGSFFYFPLRHFGEQLIFKYQDQWHNIPNSEN